MEELLRMVLSLQRRLDDLETKEVPRVTTYGLRLPIQAAAPASPVNGDLVFANGTTFNPGAGAGTYERVGGAWVKL